MCFPIRKHRLLRFEGVVLGNKVSGKTESETDLVFRFFLYRFWKDFGAILEPKIEQKSYGNGNEIRGRFGMRFLTKIKLKCGGRRHVRG